MAINCQSCRWCHAADHTFQRDDGSFGGHVELECRRHAPRSYTDDGEERYAKWPIVSDFYWCGEFTERPASE